MNLPALMNRDHLLVVSAIGFLLGGIYCIVLSFLILRKKKTIDPLSSILWSLWTSLLSWKFLFRADRQFGDPKSYRSVAFVYLYLGSCLILITWVILRSI